MGGYGSGQHFRSRFYRFTVEDCLKFELGKYELRKFLYDPYADKYYSVLEYYKNNESFYKVKCFIKNGTIFTIGDKDNYTHQINLTYQRTGRWGAYGERPMVCCPFCEQKKLTLFLKPPYYNQWACRTCHNLTYVSSKKSTRPNRWTFILAAQMGASVNSVRGALNSLRKQRYLNNYTIENLYNEDNIMKQTGIKLSSYELKELEKLAKDLDLSRSELIRRALDYYIDFVKGQKAKLEIIQGKG
jgi:hypothetical protein